MRAEIRLELSILHVIIILKEKDKLSESRIDADSADFTDFRAGSSKITADAVEELETALAKV